MATTAYRMGQVLRYLPDVQNDPGRFVEAGGYIPFLDLCMMLDW